jgi:hypothetical protein
VLAAALTCRLDDPVYTVRWRSILALHRIEANVVLAAALARSRPVLPDPARHHEYFEVLRELEGHR